jgi:hypothetical protein
MLQEMAKSWQARILLFKNSTTLDFNLNNKNSMKLIQKNILVYIEELEEFNEIRLKP